MTDEVFMKELDKMYLNMISVIIEDKGFIDFIIFSWGHRLCNQEVKNGKLIRIRKWYLIKSTFKERTLRYNRKEKLKKICISE